MPQQFARQFKTQKSPNGCLRYLLFLPQGYEEDEAKKWPLILFLHGAGERGEDLQLVKTHGIPQLVEEDPSFPFITVAPQCPSHSWWFLHLAALDELLDSLTEEYRADEDRFYLTGMSMGGFGCWHLAATYPARFAAVAPICGGGLASRGFPEKVDALKNVPIWVFHGALDPVVPLNESIRLVQRLEEVGGQVQLTIYQDAAHDAWTRTYHNPELYQWLLAHRRPQRT